MDLQDIFSVKGKKALITGSSKGLGKAMAKVLAAFGAEIIMTSRKQQELDSSKAEIVELFPNSIIHTYVVDHSKWKETDEFTERVKLEVGDIDILVNNAGTGLLSPIEEMKNQDWDYIMSLNISNQMALARAFVPGMKKKNWGRIINIASLFGITALENRTAYCASKGAVISFTRALALELAPYSINVNCISCGPMRTPLMTNSWEDPVRRQYFCDLVPLGKWGETDDVMGAVIMLASNAGIYITGQNIVIDGGASAK